MKRWGLALVALLLTACAHRPVPPLAELPLRLSPASLGRELVVQQRMTVKAYGRSQQLDVAIEADAEAVRLAVLAFGQTVARVDWDGRELRESAVRGFPPGVTGALLLRDVQLVYWPLDAIQAGLPLGWTMQADAGARELRLGGRPVIRVRYPAAGTAELDNLAAHYQVRLENWQATQ
ncbi:MAG TPA: DUF3261 domain-containing protein [Ramlibacter sp.]|uniref:DUF3261 domain-containing protein n=1 Tax=Ramlibacter sp. TaxID=1917967 RepID=UPI002ED48447